uniref:Uncharacterized protein n=1 Tax=Candidatus Berkiella cookevillensis TaxID=437022 RepID=A0A0Q9Y8V1_9GAMM
MDVVTVMVVVVITVVPPGIVILETEPPSAPKVLLTPSIKEPLTVAGDEGKFEPSGKIFASSIAGAD